MLLQIYNPVELGGNYRSLFSARYIHIHHPLFLPANYVIFLPWGAPA